jgi:hypothetical protein
MPLVPADAAILQAAAALCAYEPPGQVVSLEVMPPAIQSDLRQRAPDLSPAGGPFAATDVGEGPRTRLIISVRLRDRYVVAYEHGGRGYHVDLLVYIDGAEGSSVRPLTAEYAKPPCAALDPSNVRTSR